MPHLLKSLSDAGRGGKGGEVICFYTIFRYVHQDNLTIPTYEKGLSVPRKPKLYLPGIPAHVVQRGNNHDVCSWV